MSTQTKLSTLSAKEFFESEAIKKNVEKHLGEKSRQFITSILGIINSNANLQKCDPTSIYQCALLATTLDLTINQNLGLAWIIPYGNKAQFQIGYKGFIQLAQRSGKFININSVPVFDTDTDETVRKRLTSFIPQTSTGNVIGYCGYFKLQNGYEQILPMSIEELKAHGKKYSKSYGGLWTTDFEAMARKTVIKLIIQRYAPMSIDMQKAELADQSVIKNAETLEVDYIDNTLQTASEVSDEKENERIKNFIENAATKTELEVGLNGITLNSELAELADLKMQSLK